MEKKYHVHDLIACIENDNPFPTGNEQYKNNLKKYINEFPKEFIYVDDWMETIHSFAVYDNLENDLENFNNRHIDRKMKLSDIPELSNLVKNFFIQHESLIQFSNKFKNWVFNKSNELNNEKIIISESINNSPNNLNNKLTNNVDNVDNLNNNVDNVDNVNNLNENLNYNNDNYNDNYNLNDNVNNLNENYNNDNDSGGENVFNQQNDDILISFGGNISTINELSTYSFSSNVTLSYEELNQMCINQARKTLISSKTRDVENQKAETEQRDKLCHIIQQYFDLAEIQSEYATSKLDTMSIDELEQLQKQCEMKFDMLKTKEMIKHGLDLFEIGYDAVLPNGIPLGKNRRIVLDKGLTNSISKALFDPRTVPGLAFRRILNKHHIHLTDEVTVGLEIAKLLIKSTHIVKKQNEEEKNNDNKNLIEELSDELIEEINDKKQLNENELSDYVQDISF